MCRRCSTGGRLRRVCLRSFSSSKKVKDPGQTSIHEGGLRGSRTPVWPVVDFDAFDAWFGCPSMNQAAEDAGIQPSACLSAGVGRVRCTSPASLAGLHSGLAKAKVPAPATLAGREAVGITAQVSAASPHPIVSTTGISHTSRRLVLRGRPTLLGRGMKGSTRAHSSSVQSLA